ncbi:HNH endonuclease signature motif containing protein [Paramicrobacterium chengjingii]|uniref:DUF222 domain-containing protein n=1 Tax=Paramicrobacterium chengjingii TaxID=2769067 RepID=A0ABX6YJ87_9MICO|nr:HNH endonuclease signature motif containing protein [Microbacterium chengjingii]QPZ38857.1 DUF222 domain-containing protein [Microbacterium chengjingii]
MRASLVADVRGMRSDSAAIAAAEASRLRRLYSMLQSALQHPDIFIPMSKRASGNLTADDEMWVRRSLAHEVAGELRITPGAARGMLDDAEDLVGGLPDTVKALESGEIMLSHALTIAGQVTGLSEPDAREFEARALPKASSMTPTQFRTRAKRIREDMFPDTITERTERAAEDRRVYVTCMDDGMASITLFARAEVVQSIHHAARATGRALKAAGDQRTQAQIQADAFIDATMKGFLVDPESAPGVGPADIGADRLGGIRPTVHVTVSVETLIGTTNAPGNLDGYGPISPETARRLAAQAPSFTRLLTHPETGAVLSVGRDSYAVPSDLRRAVELRDEMCCGIGCNRPATTCDLDHTHDWQYGGETKLTNVAALCKPDHMLKHHTKWQLERTADGELVWTSPLGKRYVVPRTSNVQFAEAAEAPGDSGSDRRSEVPVAAPF